MKENQKKKLRNMFDQDYSSFNEIKKKQVTISQEQIAAQKQQLRKKIQLQKQKNELRDEKIKLLKENHKTIVVQKMKNEDRLKKLTKKIEELKNPQNSQLHFEQLRQMFKKLKRQLGIQLLLPEQQQQIDPDQMTYQQLLQLQEKIGNVSKGLNQQQRKKIPQFKYKASQQQEKNCIICCYQFQQLSNCLKLKCNHIFHQQCINQWLKSQKICPLCKQQTI